MSMFNKLTALLLCLCLPGILAFERTITPPVGAPKNIILLIGDGMGLTQITAALYRNGDSLNLKKFPVTGIVKTHSADALITDSAAGATAMACGCKTKNGVLGLDAKGVPCKTVLEQAGEAGLATGLVATSSLTHATPAAFVAHVGSRGQHEDIAKAFLQTQVDLLIGGGLQYFTERSSDRHNLVDSLQRRGYTVKSYKETPLENFQPDPAKLLAYFTAWGEPPYVTEGRDYLPHAARLAPRFLQARSEKGFFLMVEGSQIDWACHGNRDYVAIREMLDFDAAIGEALRFAQADGQTLVIVTADHETGGMAIEQGSNRDSLEIDFNTGKHTASLVPLFAYGPGSELFHGVYDNTDIYRKMETLLFRK